MKSKTMNTVAVMVEKYFEKEFSEQIIEDAFVLWKQLCEENKSACKEKKAHYIDNIFPCISYYEALKKNGIKKQDALEFMDESWKSMALKGAKNTKKILSILGLYKLYPAIFQWIAENKFGSKAGFSAKFYSLGRRHCKFDMTKCLFMDTCKKYGCPELTQCFCHTDDINNADLHPNLCWNRTQFMGNGGEFCDFDIYVKDNKK